MNSRLLAAALIILMVLSLPASMNYIPVHTQDSSAQVQDNSTASQNGTQPVIVPIPSQPLLPVQGTVTRSFSNPSGLVDNGDKITQSISWYQNGIVALSDSAGNNFSIGVPVQQGNFTISQNDTTVDQKFTSSSIQYDLYWKQVGTDGHTDKYKITIIGTSANGFTMKIPIKTSQFLVHNANQFLAVPTLDNSNALEGGIGLDWSDAVQAGYEVSLDADNNITIPLGISFSVDPTTIDTTTAKISPPSTDYYEGEKRVLKIGITTFAFYYDNSNIVYQYSTDGGNSWSGKINTGTGTVAPDVYRWTVATTTINGTNYVTLLYYHVSGSNTNFYGKRGTVVGTNISWNNPSTILSRINNTVVDGAAVAATDTKNDIIAALRYNATLGTFYYTIYNSTDGGSTWTQSLAPVQSKGTLRPVMALATLTSGGMLFAYATYTSTDFNYTVYTHTWGATQLTTKANMTASTFKEISAGSDNNNSPYIAYVLGGNAGKLAVARWNNDGTFNKFEVADASLSHSLPSISITGSTVHIYTISNGRVYDTIKTGSTWNAPTRPFGVAFTTPNYLTSGISYDGALWEESSSTFKVRFGSLTDSAQSVSTTSTNLSPLNTDYYEGEKRIVNIGGVTFAFYHNGSNIVYNYTTDNGMTWSSAITAGTGTGTFTTDSFRWTVATTSVNGLNHIDLLYYKAPATTATFYSENGNVTGTSIAWNTTPSTVFTATVPTNDAKAAAVAATDTNNNVFAAFRYYTGSTFLHQIWKSTDGGIHWTNATDAKTSNSGLRTVMALTKLAGGKMLFAYTSFDRTDITYKIYDPVSSWGTAQTISGAFLKTNTFKQISADSNSTNAAYLTFAANGTAKALKVARWNSDGTFNTIETADSTLSHSLPSITITSDGIIHIYSLNSSKIWETDKINSYWAAPKNPFGTNFTSPNMLAGGISYPAAIWTENSTAPYNLMFGTDRIPWTANTGILEPLYVYPYDSTNCPTPQFPNNFCWLPLNTTKQNHPNVPLFVIANPFNGPCFDFPTCSGPSSDYQKAISNLTKSGVVVLGYVHTSWNNGPVSYTQAKDWINKWSNWYGTKNSVMGSLGIKGIFLDEMATNPTSGNLTYYQNLTKYIHGNFTLSVGNPGTETMPKFIGTVDNLVIYENPGLPSNHTLQGTTDDGGPDLWHTTYDKNNFSFISKGISTDPGATEIQGMSPYVSYLYVTNDCPNGDYSCITNYLASHVGYLNNVPVLSTVQATDKSSGNTVHIVNMTIYQSNNLMRNGTTPFTYNETAGWQFNFIAPKTNSTYHFCYWIYPGTNTTNNSILVSPTTSTTYNAFYSPSC